MSDTLDLVFSASGPEVIFENFGDEMVVANLASGFFFSLDGSGAAPGGVVTAPLPARGADDGLVEISIRVRDPASPHELGLGEDRRKLGLAVKSIAPA